MSGEFEDLKKFVDSFPWIDMKEQYPTGSYEIIILRWDSPWGATGFEYHEIHPEDLNYEVDHNDVGSWKWLLSKQEYYSCGLIDALDALHEQQLCDRDADFLQEELNRAVIEEMVNLCKNSKG